MADEPADTPNAEFLTAMDAVHGFLVRKEGWNEIGHDRKRGENARRLVVSAIRIMRELCGEDLLREVYGACDGNDPRETLRHVATRANIASYLFLPFEGEPGSLSSIATEARAVAQGDAPDIFSRLSRTRVGVRLLWAKLDVLRWEAYLDGLGVSAVERQTAIAKAFNKQWDSIRRRWPDEVRAAFGDAAVGRRLAEERSDGQDGLRRWWMHPSEAWQDALIRSAARFRGVERRHSELG